MAFFSGESASSNTPGILLLIEFPRWNFIPGATLFLAVLSRESISPPSFLASSRFIPSLHLRPLQSASSQTIVSSCTRRGEFEEKVAQFAQSHEERHTCRNGCVRNNNPRFTPKRVYVHGMQSRVAWRTHPSVCLSTPSRATHPVHAARNRCICFRVQPHSSPWRHEIRDVSNHGKLKLNLKSLRRII